MSERSAFKDTLFKEEHIRAFAGAIQDACPEFDREGFAARVLSDPWDRLELKGRMRHISSALHEFLPGDYRAALDVLIRAAPHLPGESFVGMVPSDYVAQYGLDDWEASLPALELFTQRISAEFAVRPFILRDPARMMAQMRAWAEHDSPEVRRLASEGCRPRMPWGVSLPMLKDDPAPILPILDQLKDDESESVRRSVANNLNDIAKDNPQVVIDALRGWQGDDSEEMEWITRHALRTLVKAGHPDALDLLGFPANPAIVVRNAAVEPEVVDIGGALTFSFEIESLAEEPLNLVIDYVVHYVKANGSHAPKVWKLATRTIKPGEVMAIRKKHSFARVTTRTYYPGPHLIEPKINGQVYERVEFTVREG
jgi:3-methyladenine DNA glycosylase AlkC